MKYVMKYIVVHEHSWADLVREVQAMIEVGGELVGGVAIGTMEVCQAMLAPIPVEEEDGQDNSIPEL